MTILEPKRTKFKLQLKLMIGVALFVLVGVSVFAVVTYTKTVGLRHQVSRLEKDLSKLEAKNADLKNQLYSALSPDRLQAMAKELGFLAEKRPKYLETTVETLATQL
ncbi:MAG: septum formation initiator family protein [Patescibacteria group bacterium]